MLGKDTVHCRFVANIGMLKSVTRDVAHLSQRFQVTGVGQFIDINHRILGVLNNMSYNRRTDETGTTSNKNFHALFSVKCLHWDNGFLKMP